MAVFFKIMRRRKIIFLARCATNRLYRASRRGVGRNVPCGRTADCAQRRLGVLREFPLMPFWRRGFLRKSNSNRARKTDAVVVCDTNIGESGIMPVIRMSTASLATGARAGWGIRREPQPPTNRHLKVQLLLFASVTCQEVRPIRDPTTTAKPSHAPREVWALYIPYMRSSGVGAAVSFERDGCHILPFARSSSVVLSPTKYVYFVTGNLLWGN